MEDTKVITFFTGEEVEVLRRVLEERIEELKMYNPEDWALLHLRVMLHRLP